MPKQSLQNQTTHSGSFIPDEVVWYYAFTWDDDQSIPTYKKVIMNIVDFFSEKKLDNRPIHVFCFCEIGNGLLFIEPTKSQIVTSFKFDPDGGDFKASHAISCIEESGNGVVIQSFHKPNLRSWRCMFNWMPTCVTAVKIFTGLPLLAITPNTLYNSLVRIHYQKLGDSHGI